MASQDTEELLNLFRLHLQQTLASARIEQKRHNLEDFEKVRDAVFKRLREDVAALKKQFGQWRTTAAEKSKNTRKIPNLALMTKAATNVKSLVEEATLVNGSFMKIKNTFAENVRVSLLQVNDMSQCVEKARMIEAENNLVIKTLEREEAELRERVGQAQLFYEETAKTASLLSTLREQLVEVMDLIQTRSGDNTIPLFVQRLQAWRLLLVAGSEERQQQLKGQQEVLAASKQSAEISSKSLEDAESDIDRVVMLLQEHQDKLMESFLCTPVTTKELLKAQMNTNLVHMKDLTANLQASSHIELAVQSLLLTEAVSTLAGDLTTRHSQSQESQATLGQQGAELQVNAATYIEKLSQVSELIDNIKPAELPLTSLHEAGTDIAQIVNELDQIEQTCESTCSQYNEWIEVIDQVSTIANEVIASHKTEHLPSHSLASLQEEFEKELNLRAAMLEAISQTQQQVAIQQTEFKNALLHQQVLKRNEIKAKTGRDPGLVLFLHEDSHDAQSASSFKIEQAATVDDTMFIQTADELLKTFFNEDEDSKEEEEGGEQKRGGHGAGEEVSFRPQALSISKRRTKRRQ